MVWSAGAFVLLSVLVRRALTLRVDTARTGLAFSMVIACLVSAVAAFIAFVVVVNIFERVGIGH